MRVRNPWPAGVAASLLFAAMGLPLPAASQQTYKCGGAYQDRPCRNEDTQKRYSSESKRFTAGKPDPNIPRRCATMADEGMPYWDRLYRGEPIDKLKAEIDALPDPPEQRTRMRDTLVSMSGLAGNPRQVRSQFEEQCVMRARKQPLPKPR